MKKIIITLAAASALVFNACGDGKGGITSGDVNNPATASGDYDENELAKFQFETTDYKFEPIQEGDHVKYNFKFKNVGKRELIISDAKGSCGCTIAEYPEDPVKPGDEGEIKVDFDSKNKSYDPMETTKTVTVIANTQPNKVTLKIHGLVKKSK
jgi:hypothetical protein